MIVKPFSKITCVVGEPVFISRRANNKEFQEIKESLEKYMVDTIHKMDSDFNHKPVEQDLTARAFKRELREERAARKNK